VKLLIDNADVEIGVAEGAEEDLLRLQQHEHRIDAVDLHAAIDQRAHPVVVADGDAKREPAHSATSPSARQRRSVSSVVSMAPSFRRHCAGGVTA
jgi:hypothetical protein